ncbi:hypothetical protein AGDE_16123 [Angomonas deanei]|uniref:Telomerase ribonucleoprotein complex - RNA binding domain containing protein, putative n=1 Tax=Angomonas deanei TaxID=59799 RepID=A0A7G2CTN7_9TRYP|nr:hypothetical protein AGDE_16123 [Angomonas deanei]CAD2222304.1 Telomerase ribonucleoprotein complex - RNA binding domain containing protein, putative [Angomonas deanei]|eukprot:EPY17687.1 hypothetical protein AGDE_16123 [Angomonas deanei]
MSSLCTLPTHKGAFFLKDFLLDYFGIRIVAKETAGGESKEIYLPPQQTLMVWVYVLHASPSIVGSRCLGDRRHTNNNSSQPTHSGSFTSHLLQLPYFQCLWRQLQRFRVEFDVQPSDMAAGVLRKHIQTRPNGMKYVSFGLLEYIGQYCPMVVQFEFGGGVLQVYGPSVVKDVPSTGPSKKRYRSQPEGSATRLKRVRGETTTPSSSSVEHGIKVSNAILFEGSRQNLAGPLFSPTAVAREIEYAMDALYYTLHPRSFRKLYQTHKNRMLCHRKKRQRGEAIPDEVTLPTAEEVRITDEMLRHIFPFTVRGEGRLTEHLRGTIKSLLHQVCHLNVRGIFLKLFHKRKNLYQSPTSLLDGLISLDEVELYLRECFSKLHSEQDKSISFWGVDTDSANENIASISRNFRGWMQNNKPFLLRDFLDKVKVGKIPFVAGLFPLFGKHRNRRSLLLQRIVAQLSFFLSQYVVPFLLKKQFYFSRLNTKSNQYSFNIQEELCFLRDRHYGRLRRDSYPFRTILHNNNILITPLSVWNKAVRQEMKSYRREGRLAPLDSSSCTPTDDGLLLYASVRFLLTLQLDEVGEDCAVRLRPIAVLREGTRQALLNKSKGLLSYSSRLYHFLSRCTGVVQRIAAIKDRSLLAG